MIQAVMLIVLGFLAASLIGVILAPSLWRRAYRLSRKRLEKTLPISLPEIEASRDGLRAFYAVKLRRLETALASAKQKAALQLVDGSRLQIQIVALREQIAGLELKLAERSNAATVLGQAVTRRVPELEREIAALNRELAGRSSEAADLVNRLGRKDESLEAARKSAVAFEEELNRLRETLEKSSTTRSGRRLQRASQWTLEDYRSEYDRLNLDLSRMRQHLAQLQDKDAQASGLLKGELQKLAELILVSAQTRPAATQPERIDTPATRRPVAMEVRRDRPEPWPQTPMPLPLADIQAKDESYPAGASQGERLTAAASAVPVPSPGASGGALEPIDSSTAVPTRNDSVAGTSIPRTAPMPPRRSRILNEVTAKAGPEVMPGVGELALLNGSGGGNTGGVVPTRGEARPDDVLATLEKPQGDVVREPEQVAIATGPEPDAPAPSASEIAARAAPLAEGNALAGESANLSRAGREDKATGAIETEQASRGGEASQQAFSDARNLQALSELLVMEAVKDGGAIKSTVAGEAKQGQIIDGEATATILSPQAGDPDAAPPRTLLDRLRGVTGEPANAGD